MRLTALLTILLWLLVQAGGAIAADKAEDQAPERAAATLDQLFDDLKHQTSEPSAQRIVRQIWQEWNSSGSDTIDLLMGWAARAMSKNNHAMAESLLNQVTVLAPEYAEGWNRRATLYYAMDDYSRSIADIERTLQLEPRHFGALSGLGVILQKSSSERKALDAWYKVLEVYPANKRAQQTVIELEEKLAGEGI